MKAIVGIFLCTLSLVELIQIFVSFKRYCASPENLIQVAILVGNQEVTKRCRLSWLANSALVYGPKCGGKGGIAGYSCAQEPKKIWDLTPYLGNIYFKDNTRNTTYHN